MENNIEYNKERARIMAIYAGETVEWQSGQEVGIIAGVLGYIVYYTPVGELVQKGLKPGEQSFKATEAINLRIRLKPLGEISDRDAEDLGGMYKNLVTITPLDLGKRLAKNLLNPTTLDGAVNEYSMSIIITDFFRSRGYALPYGKWSVEELAEFGIYKII